jgi:hypothetical protein
MKYKPLSEKEGEMLIGCLLAEKSNSETFPQIKEIQDCKPEDKNYPMFFLPKIILKRIEGFTLPISFNQFALIALLAFVDVPGTAILLLIDCLNKYEGQVVTVEKLCQLYPNGFYAEEEWIHRIDDIKLRQQENSLLKWEFIY